MSTTLIQSVFHHSAVPGAKRPRVRLITPQSPPLVRFLNPVTLVGELWRRRHLIRQFAWRETRGRYQGSRLGLAWSLLTPLATLAVYTFVFHFVLQVRWGLSPAETPIQFALTLFCGLLAFQLFSESIQRACGVVVRHPGFVKRVVFPLEVLPVAGVLTTFLHMVCGLLIVAVLWSACVEPVGRHALLLPVVLAPFVCFVLGVSWLLAALGVFVRDLAPAVTILCQLLLFATPVVYPLSAVPRPWRELLLLNPLTVYVENARRVLLWNEPPDWVALAVASGASLVALQVGYACFMKTKRAFADAV